MLGKTLLIRADASADIGAGHVMRCIALAQAWQRTGGRAIFALAAGGELEGRILSEGAELARIRAKPGTGEDAVQTADLRTRSQSDWLVLDGYHFSADYRRSMDSDASHLLVMDDGAECQICECDIVLNPDPDASIDVYPERDGRTQFLLGPDYALLRREFLKFPKERRDVAEKAKRVLITFGGGDPHNVTLELVRALREIKDLELDVTVVAGASYQHRRALQAAVEGALHRTRLLWSVENMPELMAQADLAITAGGGTCYELAFMRVPMFLIAMAKNHERAVGAFALAEAAFSAGWFSSLKRDALATLLRHVICDRELRKRLADKAARMVDGKGAERVVKVMDAICRHGRKVTA